MAVLFPSGPFSPRRYIGSVVAVGLLTAGAFLISLSLGSTGITLREVAQALSGAATGMEHTIILDIRLPRVLTGLYVGGMLALAGCLMQVLLRNPLADPYVLGVSGGAAVFALLGLIVGLTGYLINIAAFTGALFSIVLVFMLARSGRQWNPLRVLLTGVVVAAGWAALISFLLAISPPNRVQGLLFWLMGDLSYVEHSMWGPILLLAVLSACLLFARSLNLLAAGEQTAASLGVNVPRLQYFVYFAASLLTATAVMQAGSVGFIGLVVPHLVRLLFGSDHRILLPVSVMLGGSLLVIADALARSVIAPGQLPVGVLTAMLGVPLFLVLLQTASQRARP